MYSNKKTIVSNRYASAIFEVAKESKAIDEMESELLQTLRIVNSSEGSSRLLDIGLDKDTKFTIVKKISTHLAMSDLMSSVISLMIRNNHLDLLPSVSKKYKEISMEHKKVSVATVTSAIPLQNKYADSIKEQLEKLLGKNILLEFLVEPSIVGGIVIKSGSMVFDASISHSIQKFKKKKFLREKNDN